VPYVRPDATIGTENPFWHRESTPGRLITRGGVVKGRVVKGTSGEGPEWRRPGPPPVDAGADPGSRLEPQHPDQVDGVVP
jgi:hypothetical protein